MLFNIIKNIKEFFAPTAPTNSANSETLLKQLRDEIEDLKTKLIVKEQSAKEMKDQYSDLIDNLKQELEENEKNLNVKEYSTIGMKDQYGDIIHNLKNKETKNEALKRDLSGAFKRLNKRIAEQKIEIEKLKKENKELAQAKQQSPQQASNGSDTVEIKDLKIQLEARTKLLDQANVVRTNLRKDLTEAKDLNTELKDVLKKEKSKSENLEEQLLEQQFLNEEKDEEFNAQILISWEFGRKQGMEQKNQNSEAVGNDQEQVNVNNDTTSILNTKVKLN
jgi:chromosome segregation ATPase